MKTRYYLKDLNIYFEFESDSFSGFIIYPNGNKRKIKTSEILNLFVLIKLNNIKPN